MSTEAEKQIKRLDARFNSAVVDEVSEGVYEVFVPGAVREVTTVKAESEEEALEKTRANLIAKIEHNAAKKVELTGESDGTLEVDGGRHDNAASNPQVEEGEA
jgi:hypothetical protein